MSDSATPQAEGALHGKGQGVLPRIIDSMANQALEALDLAAAIGHPGESGRAREEVIRQFLREILPPDFGIDTGFVLDASGGLSRQVDVVIYRRSRYPLLAVGGVKHFMIESVAAVLEVKATIGSVSVLTDAMENIASVKSLDRTGDGRNYVTSDHVPRPVAVDATRDQVWGGVVAGSSMTFDKCLDAYAHWLDTHPNRRVWPNSYYDVREFRINYVRSENDIPRWATSDPTTADGVQGGGGSIRTWGPSPPLAFLAADLLDFLQVVPHISFGVTSGLSSTGTGQSGYFYRTMIPKGTQWVKLVAGPAAADSAGGDSAAASDPSQ